MKRKSASHNSSSIKTFTTHIVLEPPRLNKSQNFSRSFICRDSQPPVYRKPTLLSQLQRRHKQTGPVDPRESERVVKQYLIPMLESNVRSSHNTSFINGKASFGSFRRKTRLSDSLKFKLTAYLQELTQKKSNQQKICGEIDECRTKLSKFKENLTRKRIFLEFLNATADTQKSFNSSGKIDSLITKNKVNCYRRRMNKLRKSMYGTRGEYNNETITGNSILKATKILTHLHSQHFMTNIIMGESLKWLYYTLANINSYTHLEKPLLSLVNSAKTGLLRVLRKMDARIYTITVFLYINLNTLEKNEAASDARRKLATETQESKIHYKEHLNRLVKKIILLKVDVHNNETSYSYATKKFEDLENLYMRAKASLKGLYGNKPNTDQEREKICAECGNVYTDSRNLNWSCCKHTSEWSGFMYWCCGKTSVNAIGCTRSSHFSKEDSEDKMCPEASAKCSSCRKLGHKQFMCPKDPNVRTHANQLDEIERVRNLQFAKFLSKVNEAKQSSGFEPVRTMDMNEYMGDIEFLRTAKSFHVSCKSLNDMSDN